MLQPERGQLKVSMYANSGLLTVSVGQARNLQSKWQPKCNAYVKVTLFPEHEASNARCKSMLVKNNNAPSFEEKFSFELLEEDLKKRILISVWHKEPKNGRSEFLGCMSFGIQHIVSNRRIVNGWYYLLTDKLGKRKHLQVPAQGDNMSTYDPSLIPSINQGVNWMEPHVFVLKKEPEGSFGFEVTGYGPARVAYIHAGSVSESMGLQVQDRVVRMNGSNVSRSGEESVSRLIRGCERQLILEIHRPRRSGQPSGDVSFVRGSDARAIEPISSAPSHNGLYEEIYDVEPQRPQFRPQPCGTEAPVYGSKTHHHALIHDGYQTHDASIYGGKRNPHPMNKHNNTSLLSSQRAVDDFDIHALSPIVSADEERSTRGDRYQGRYSKDDCDFYSERKREFAEPVMYHRRDKFSYISQWRDEVMQSFPSDPQPTNQPTMYPYNQPITRPMHRSRVQDSDKAYESDSQYYRRSNVRRFERVDQFQRMPTTRAYESEDCRGMRFTDRKEYSENPEWVPQFNASQMKSRSQQDLYSQQQDIYSRHEDLYSGHMDPYSGSNEPAYIPMGDMRNQQGHLRPIIEEEEVETPRKQPPDGSQDPRVRNIKMASYMMDYSPPYMKTKSKNRNKHSSNKSNEEAESQNIESKNKENNCQNSKRHYQPIGEEDTKYKSKRVLQPIGEEDTGKIKTQKPKSLFGMCGGINSKTRKKSTFSCKP